MIGKDADDDPDCDRLVEVSSPLIDESLRADGSVEEEVELTDVGTAVGAAVVGGGPARVLVVPGAGCGEGWGSG